LAWPPGPRSPPRGLNLVNLTVAILIYVYTVAARCPRRVSVAGLAATEVVLVVVWLARPRSIGDGSTLAVDGLIAAAAWWLGDGTRRRQEAVVVARQRAAELERAREELAAEVAKAGVRVEVRIEGTPSELPAGLDLSAYRIVQEALTNVVRHAGPATARVAATLPVEEVPR
jgi:hypothetical protein